MCTLSYTLVLSRHLSQDTFSAFNGKVSRQYKNKNQVTREAKIYIILILTWAKFEFDCSLYYVTLNSNPNRCTANDKNRKNHI